MSFRLQINLILIFTAITLAIGALWFFKTEQEKIIQINMQAQAQAIAALVSEDLAKMVFLDDPDIATDITRRIQQIQDIHAAYFFDTDAVPILSINPEKNKTIHHSIAVNTNVFYQGTYLGNAHFIFNSLLLKQARNRLTKVIFIALILIILFNVLFAIYLDKQFIQRLSELSRALKKTTEDNDYNLRLTEEKNDEIGQARSHFNQLVANIKQKTDDLFFRALHDELTGLYNRHYLLGRIAQSLNQDSQHALCYLDLDQFKIVNDTCGHLAGDTLLKKLSQRLLEFITCHDNLILGRIGGDEFILLIENADQATSEQYVQSLVQMVREFEFQFAERKFYIGVSVGMILYGKTEQTTLGEDLLSAADFACYQAKSEGRDKVVIYDFEDIDLQTKQQDMNQVAKLYEAIENNHFELFLQPIVDAKPPHKAHHYETLIRLPISEGQYESPAVFIPIAQRYGLSKKLDFWVIENACRLLRQSPEFMAQITNISVNLSADFLMESNSKELVENTMQAYQIPYHKICFEITETGLISDFEEVKRFITYFRNKGCVFAIDDFGTGMASFEYLSELDVELLKIDGVFVKNMVKDPVMHELVDAMSQIGHITDTLVIAEYVEDQETIDALNKIGVDFLQGYHFSAPKPFSYFAGQMRVKTDEQP